MTDIADAKQRRQALAVEQSFICEAPAGSGKTELLTQRFLTLLASVEAPEEIMAITFTRKAQAEMHHRITEALQRGEDDQSPIKKHDELTWNLARAALAQDKKQHWQLLNNPNRLKIWTFDSLCANLTRSLPISASLGAQLNTVDDATYLYSETVHQLLRDIDKNTPWQQALINLLRHQDNNVSQVEKLLVNMLHRRNAWLPLLGREEMRQQAKAQLECYLQHAIDDHIATLTRLIPDDLKSQLLQLAAYAANNLQHLDKPSPIRHCLNRDIDSVMSASDGTDVQLWLGICELLLTKQNDWRKQANVSIGFPTDGKGEEKKQQQVIKQTYQKCISGLQEIPDLLTTLAEVRLLPHPRFETEQWQILDAIVSLLPVLAAHLQLTFRAHNRTDFSEISQRALQALGDELQPTDLALQLDYKIRHILVDEFQDTSVSQYELLKKLVAGWEPDDGRTLFVVGDVMQSIYAFRDAKVGLFLYCKRQGIGNVKLKPLQLRSNFRSQTGIVQWMNNIFSAAFPGRENIPNGAVTFTRAEPVLAATDQQPVTVHGFCHDQNQTHEAQTVVNIVRQTWQKNTAASIAILVRNRGHLHHLVPALQDAQISFQAVNIEPLAQQPVVMDLLSLLKALLLPQDTIAWLSVLRAPWCGLSLSDLILLRQLQNPEILLTIAEQIEHYLMGIESVDDAREEKMSAAGEQRLRRVWPVLQMGIAGRQRKSLREWLEGVWLCLGGPAGLQHSAELKNAERFFELLDQIDTASDVESFSKLEEEVKKLYAAPDPDADQRLQIMTIHQAKGLEFDTVILPSLQRPPRNPEEKLLLWEERLTDRGQEELLLAPVSARGNNKYPIYLFLENFASKRAAFEATRLLYVACSRAKNSLHLLAQFTLSQTSAGNNINKPRKGSLLDNIWPAVSSHIHWHREFTGCESNAEQVNAGESSAQRPLTRLPLDWQLPQLAEGKALAAYVVSADFDNEEEPLTLWQNPTPRHIGTVVHQVLLEMSVQGLQVWNSSRLEAQKSLRRAHLIQLGVPQTDLAHALAEVQRLCELLLSDGEIAWMLAPDRQRFAEFPVSVMQFDEVQPLSIDLLLPDVKGETWVVDFKTSAPTPDQGQAEFIQLELATYRRIMSTYRRAVIALGYPNVRCALYFPAIRQWGHYSL